MKNRRKRKTKNLLLPKASPSFILHPNIPEEIVIEILSRLPIESLLRFRCVNKLWKSLISDPTFTLSSSQRKHRIAIGSPPFDSIDAEDASSSSRPILPKQMVFDYYNNKVSKNTEDLIGIGCMQILGSCNGLLLVSYLIDLYLWNTTTRQCTKLLSIPTDGPSFQYKFTGKTGLCYDSNSDDYKAVFVVDGSATVISLRSKSWNNKLICSFADDVADGSDAEDEARSESGLVVNGKLHWVINQFADGNIHSPNLDRVVYFDPLTDEFVELPMPDVPNDGKYNYSNILGLGILEGRLCMTRRLFMSRGFRGRGDEVEPDFDFNFNLSFNSIDEVKPAFIEVFVMEKHGEVESWRSVFIMSEKMQTDYQRVEWCGDTLYRKLVPLCFSKNGEVLFSVNGNTLLAYHPDKMSQRYVEIEHRHIFSCEASYEESLASPAAYGHEEDWIVEWPDALKLLHYIWRDNYFFYSVREILNPTEEESSIKKVESSINEEDDCFLKGCWKKEEDQEKFSRREKARFYSISAKDKKHEIQQRTREKRKTRRVRKNERKKKLGKNLEVEDLHKQVLDFYMK